MPRAVLVAGMTGIVDAVPEPDADALFPAVVAQLLDLGGAVVPERPAEIDADIVPAVFRRKVDVLLLHVILNGRIAAAAPPRPREFAGLDPADVIQHGGRVEIEDQVARRHFVQIGADDDGTPRRMERAVHRDAVHLDAALEAQLVVIAGELQRAGTVRVLLVEDIGLGDRHPVFAVDHAGIRQRIGRVRLVAALGRQLDHVPFIGVVRPVAPELAVAREHDLCRL